MERRRGKGSGSAGPRTECPVVTLGGGKPTLGEGEEVVCKVPILGGDRKVAYEVSILEEGGKVVGGVSGYAKCPRLNISSLPE